MTPYALWLSLCGLSQGEAAAFHGVRLDTVKSWSTGRNPVKPSVIDELRGLYAQIQRAAAQGKAAWEDGGRAGQIDLGLAADDHEARSLGWPCVGAQRRCLGMLLASLPAEVAVKLVPRGSTTATAAAADAHGR